MRGKTQVNGLDPAGMRRLNRVLTLSTLRQAGGGTVVEIGALTGLSRRTTELILDSLIADGLVRESASRTAAPNRPVGRPARGYEFAADAASVAGVIVFPEYIQASVADLNGEIRSDALVETSPQLGRRERLAAIVDCYEQALRRGGFQRRHVRAATIATSGPVRDNGKVDLRMTIPEWFGFSLSEALAPAFECHVFAENDTKLGVVGERWKGVAAGLDDVIWIWNNGHRSGVGIVIAGRPYRGLDGRSGEIVWAENLHFRPIRDSVFGMADQPGSPDALKADALVARARSGERTALDEVNKVVDEIESGITTLVWTLAPQMVVLGPTLGRAADLIAPVLTERLRQYNDVLPVICGSSLGNQAIMYGAIRTSLDYVEQTLFHGDIRAVGRLAMGSEG